MLDCMHFQRMNIYSVYILVGNMNNSTSALCVVMIQARILKLLFNAQTYIVTNNSMQFNFIK